MRRTPKQPTSPSIDGLFASMDLDVAASVPLVTADISTLMPAAQPTAIERIRDTIDLVIDKIEPFFTGDFIRATMDLVATQPKTKLPPMPPAPSEDLIVVDRVENAFDIVIDAKDLLTEEKSTSLELAIVEADPISCPVAPETFGTPLKELARAPADEYRADPDAKKQDPINPTDVFARANADLADHRYADARKLLDALVRDHPTNTEYAAAAAFARFSLEQDEKNRILEAQRLAEQAQINPYCAPTQIYAGRMFLALRRPQGAVRHLRAAVELLPDRADLLTELRTANEMLAHVRDLFTYGAAAGDDPKRTHAAARWSALELRRRDARIVPGAIAAFGFLTMTLFVLAVQLELGVRERWLDPSDGFAWMRSVALAVVAIVGIRAAMRHRPLAAADFQINRYTFGASLVVGAMLGAMLTPHGVKLPLATIAVMTIFRVAAEELFFRAFIGRALLRGLAGSVTPIVVSGVLYLAYGLTFHAEWGEASTLLGMVSLAVSGFVAGSLYAFIQQKSESLTAPFIAHLIAAVTVAFASAL